MITKTTFFVGATGSFEEVTVKKWKRLRVLSHKSIGNLTNIAPRVIGQRVAMTRLGLISNASGVAIKFGLAEYLLKRSWWPMFMGINMKGAFDFTDPEAPVYHPEDLIISKGSLPSTPMLTASATASNDHLQLTWTELLQGTQEENDYMVVAVYNRNTEDWYINKTFTFRQHGNIDKLLDDFPLSPGDELDVYIFFSQGTSERTGRRSLNSYNLVTVGS